MKKTILSLLSLLFLIGTAQNTYAQKNFADKVLFASSEYYEYPSDNCAAQILGSPNVYPNYGDNEYAYSTSSYGGDHRDTLSLWFNNAGPADSIFIYQTNEPGLIDSVWIYDSNNSNWDLVYSAIPASSNSGLSEMLKIGFDLTSYNVSQIKIGIATNLATDYVQIDAVAIAPNNQPLLAPSNAGNAIVFDGLDDKFNTLMHSSNACTADSKTIMAWVKVDSASANIESSLYNGAAIVSDGDYAYFGIFQADLGTGDKLYVYNYDDDTRSVAINYNLHEWMHISMVQDNGILYAYKNGQFVGSIQTEESGYMGGFMTIGYNAYNDVYFGGEIESVSTYNIGLSAEQIRESMHVTPEGDTPGLTGHYNFNNDLSYYSNGYNNMLEGSPMFIESVLPIGPGAANSDIEQTGMVAFTGTNYTATYDTHSSGEVTASHIMNAPYSPPTGIIVDNTYWVINQFNQTEFSADYTFTTNNELNTSLVDCDYVLYSRPFNGFGTWNMVDTADAVTANELSFNAISDALGQFVIIKSGNCPSPTSVSDITSDANSILVYPNPSNGLVNVILSDGMYENITISNNIGQIVYSKKIETNSIALNLNPGMYFITVNSSDRRMVKKIIINQ